jgi:uncharacterized protein YcfL
MRRFALVAAVLTAALVAGCQSDLSPSPGLGDPYPAPLNDPQIAVLAPDLRPWLGFHPAIVTDDGRRPLQVEVPLRNLSDRQLLTEYRILFFDERGATVAPVMGWEMLPLDPKQTARMRGGALSTEASHWKLEVRWSR